MTDIVERLHSKSPYLHDSSAERTMAEAAAEIERLRAAVPAEIAKGTYALAQEIIRLRTALKECAADYVSPPCSVAQGAMYTAAEFQRRMRVARRALWGGT